MEIIKEKTRFKLSEEDRETLIKAKDIIDMIFCEMDSYVALLGYNGEEIGQIYYCLESIVDAEDRELVLEEV